MHDPDSDVAGPFGRAAASLASLPALATLLLLAGASGLSGCAAVKGTATPVAGPGPGGTGLPWPGEPRELAVIDGRTGEVIGWEAMIARAAAADVIIVGEQHDDAIGHAAQRAIAEDLAETFGTVHVAVEMLERDEQPAVDDWLEGLIDTETMMDETGSESWFGDGSWRAWYQPVLDVAKDSGGRVIAANAPRRYVRMARQVGYERLAAMGPPRTDFFTIPETLDDGPYWEKFLSFSANRGEPITEDSPVTDEQRERARSFFRSQYLWDTTMAGSLADARQAMDAGEVAIAPVVFLVGQFHSDHEGGTTAQFRRMRPGDAVLVVSLQPQGPLDGLDDEDDGRADVIIRTREEARRSR